MVALWISRVAVGIVAVLAVLLFMGLAQAQQPPRAPIYNERGQYQGRLERDYSGRCCAIYDERGRYRGRVETREPRSTGPSPDIRGTWGDRRR
jgi:hypothetical protein